MTYQTIITNAGRAAIAACVATDTHLRIAQLAVGDGGGESVSPKAAQTALVNEVWRGDVGRVQPVADQPTYILVETTLPSADGGFTCREIGLYDAAGTLIAVGNMPESYKPALAEGTTREMIIRVILDVGAESVCDVVLDSSILLDAGKYECAVLTREEYDALIASGGVSPQVIYFVKGTRDVSAAVAQLEALADEASGKISELKNAHAEDVAGLEARADGLDASVSALGEKAGALESAAAEDRGKHAEDVAALEAEITALKAADAAAQETLAGLPALAEDAAGTAVEALKGELEADVAAANAAAENAAAQAQAFKTACDASGEAVSARVAQLEAANAELSAKVAELSATLATFPGMGDIWNTLAESVTTETAQREAAVSAEAAARSAADASEQTARAAADEALAARIAEQLAPQLSALKAALGTLEESETQTHTHGAADGDATSVGWVTTLANATGCAENAFVIPKTVAFCRRTNTNGDNATTQLYLRILRADAAGTAWTVAWQSTNTVRAADTSSAGDKMSAWTLENVDGRGAIPAGEKVLFVQVASADAAANAFVKFGCKSTNCAEAPCGLLAGTASLPANTAQLPSAYSFAPVAEIAYATELPLGGN